MTRPASRRLPPSRFVSWVIVPGLALIAAQAGLSTAPRLVLINETPSLPRGLYLRTFGAAPRVGSVVALRQPDAARPYLAGLGMPGEVLLIKRVAAAAGDPVCAGGSRLQAGQRAVEVAGRDRQGVSLPAWRGCRLLQDGEVFVLGDTANSFDGRYFGPTATTTLQGVYREVLRW